MVLKPNLTIFFASFRWGSVSAEVSGPEENIGIRLTSGFHMEPEESTAASIVRHPQRHIFVVRDSKRVQANTCVYVFTRPSAALVHRIRAILYRPRWPQSCKVQLRGGIWAQPDRGEEQEIFLSLC